MLTERTSAKRRESPRVTAARECIQNAEGRVKEKSKAFNREKKKVEREIGAHLRSTPNKFLDLELEGERAKVDGVPASGEGGHSSASALRLRLRR